MKFLFKMHLLTTSVITLLAAHHAAAWGVVGHATVATIANNYLTSQAQTYVSGLLGSGVTMASVASWADDYRTTTAGKFSAPYHFIGSHVLGVSFRAEADVLSQTLKTVRPAAAPSICPAIVAPQAALSPPLQTTFVWLLPPFILHISRLIPSPRPK